jgi:hypothetical protein
LRWHKKTLTKIATFYSKSIEFRKTIYYLLNLVFTPHNYIQEHYLIFKKPALRLPFDFDIYPLLDYFYKNYTGLINKNNELEKPGF